MALFLVDCYHGDFERQPANWAALARARPMGFIGAILKCSDGVYGHQWFRDNWRKAKDAGGPRRGVDWFCGTYHYMRFDGGRGGTPEQQADAFARNLQKAGGLDANDIMPFVDAEAGGGNNKFASRERVIEYVTRYVKRINNTLGRDCILYARGFCRDLNINTKMGCIAAWNPSYTAVMSVNGYQMFRREEILLWQYTDGQVNKTPFPSECPEFGRADVNVFLGTVQGGGNMNDLDLFRSTLCSGKIPVATTASQTVASTRNASTNASTGAPHSIEMNGDKAKAVAAVAGLGYIAFKIVSPV